MRGPDYDRLLAAAAAEPRMEIVEALTRAVRTGSPMWVGYQAQEGKIRRHYVDRANLIWTEGALYLHAHCPHLKEPIRVKKNLEFRVDRFAQPPGHPVVEVLEGVPCVEAELPRFDLVLWMPANFAARFQPIPGELRIADAADGGKIVRFRETIPLRAVRRALSFGEYARVLEPDFVRDDLRAVVERMRRNFEP
jgi:predicted DNA-binding transcriptional regulator YafY